MAAPERLSVVCVAGSMRFTGERQTWDICGMKASLRVRDTAFTQVIRSAAGPAVTVCKAIGSGVWGPA
jgi:hypothetical protein